MNRCQLTFYDLPAADPDRLILRRSCQRKFYAGSCSHTVCSTFPIFSYGTVSCCASTSPHAQNNRNLCVFYVHDAAVPLFFPEFIRILTQKFAPLRSKAVQIADFLPDSAPAASRRSAAFCLKKRIRFRLFCGIARTAEQNFVQIAN